MLNRDQFIQSLRKRAADLNRAADLIEQFDMSDLRVLTTELANFSDTPHSIFSDTPHSISKRKIPDAANTQQAQPEPVPSVKSTKRNKTGRVLTCHGLRAGVLRYLFTGEASVAAIAHATGSDFSKVKSVCVQLVHDDFAITAQRTLNVINKQIHTMTVYILTEKGKEEAKSFVDNPTIMIRNQQAMRNAQKTQQAKQAKQA